MKASFVRPRQPAPAKTALLSLSLPTPASPSRPMAAELPTPSAGGVARAGAAAAASGAAWSRPRAPLASLAAGPGAGALARHGGPPNVLHAPHLSWGARTHVVRARPLDACALEALLSALSPHQFAFIRDNVFVPPKLQHLHARLWARSQARTGTAPLRPLLDGLTRGGRTDKLSYLFAFFHLSAGSHAGNDDGAWCSVASPRDARTLVRLAQALAPSPALASSHTPASSALPTPAGPGTPLASTSVSAA